MIIKSNVSLFGILRLLDTKPNLTGLSLLHQIAKKLLSRDDCKSARLHKQLRITTQI